MIQDQPFSLFKNFSLFQPSITIRLNNFTILQKHTFKRQSVMEKSYTRPFSKSSFKKALHKQQDPIRIQDSEPKSFPSRGFKQLISQTDHFNNEPKNSRSLQYTSFATKNPQNTVQPETSTSFIFHRFHRTVERLYNSKEKKSNQFTSKHSLQKNNKFSQRQNSLTKNWVNEVKPTTFDNFLQIVKPQNQKEQSTISFVKNSKLQKYKPQANRHNFESLRETQDTIPESFNLPKSSGPKISDFQLLRLLGKGKNGQVHLAIHKMSGFACGLKIIKKRTLQRGTTEQRIKAQEQLLNEIKIQMYLRHSNLIELYGVFNDTQNIYLIQQLGVNGQLYELMKKRRKFSQETTALVASDIISGIEYMHRQKVIHRDLKPQNMVLIYGICKICDFGWSIYNSENDLRTTLCGTLLYISPEMLTGNNYNEKIDIWAYGIFVYELFTGENPFKIRDKSDLNRVITEEVAIGENMPHKLKDFLLFVLRKDIRLRPAAGQIRRHKWLHKYQDLETSEELAKM